MFNGILSVLSSGMLLFAALPAGTTYKLQSYGMGSGGVANSTSSSYAMEGISGETSGLSMTGTTYNGGSGFITTEQANVPAPPTFTNPSNYYNKLRIIIDTGSNPSDAVFAVAISTDNFTTTNYVQSDLTVGATLGIEDYLTYSSWGSGTGVNIIGLSANTTYKVKVRAMQGKFTESAYSGTSTAATVNPTLTFDLDAAFADSETAAPYNVTFPDLLANTNTQSNERIWLDFDTNGDNGGKVYIYGLNNGLRSTKTAYTVPSGSVNLSGVSEGYGGKNDNITQSSGGPFTVVAPYDVTGNNVGIVDTSLRNLYSSTAPIVGGRASFRLSARVSATTPSSNDYSDVLTIVSAANF